jgi:hypothetical protein
MIRKILNLVNGLKYDPNNLHEGLGIFLQYLISFNIMISSSLDDYMLRNRSLKRVMITFFANFSAWLEMCSDFCD